MNQKGFTLIELIIVVMIITILASILIPAGNQARQRARMAKAQSHVSVLELGITAFQTDFGYYPTKNTSQTVETSNQDILELLSGFTFSGSGESATKSPSSNPTVTGANWNGPYLEIDASDTSGGVMVDPWNNAYTFALDLDGNAGSTPPSNNVYSFDIMSGGPDGSVNGTDDITNY